MQRTLAMLSRYNIVKAVTSGPRVDEWKAASPDRIIASLAVGTVIGAGFGATASAATLRQLLAAKCFETIGEFAPQYDGIRPADVQLEPYFLVAEELDIPLGIHQTAPVRHACGMADVGPDDRPPLRSSTGVC